MADRTSSALATAPRSTLAGPEATFGVGSISVLRSYGRLPRCFELVCEFAAGVRNAHSSAVLRTTLTGWDVCPCH
jgi:hypothetical protein